MGESVSWSLGTERGDDDFVTLNLGSATVRACVCVCLRACVRVYVSLCVGETTIKITEKEEKTFFFLF